MEKLKVAIADDNDMMLKMLDDIVESDEDLNVIGMAKDGEEAYELIRDKQPDVVLLDVIMPKVDGLGVLHRVREDAAIKKTPCFIMVSAAGGEQVTEDAFALGADYYIMKPFDSKEMVARVRAVLRRYHPVKTEAPEREKTKCVEYDGITINLTNYSVVCDGKNVEMPPKELELLYCLASSPNQVFTREQLLDRIWGYEYVGDTRTVDVHIKRLREKIKDHPRWSLSTVWGIGYKFETR